MTFKTNMKLAGLHAFLSPSNYHWLDYDEEKLRRVFYERQQVKRGTELHEYAQKAITLGVKQADNGTTLSMYINDCIGFRMEPEVPLFHTEDCFGTADALGFRNNVLRISDLKTGVSPASQKQLLIYAALFFLQFFNVAEPSSVRTILRIYQNDAIDEYEPDPMEIYSYMQKIQQQAALVAELRDEDS